MSERHVAARKKYWRDMDPIKKTKRMRAIAIIRQKKMTKAERSAHALMMVAARKAKAAQV